MINKTYNQNKFEGEKGFNLFASYMNTWCDLGIDHVQFNFVDSETLKAAQTEPEKYSELTVRVAGYSAMYVELNRMAQEAIIARTVQKI
jgi:pyruvate-formate lyase